MTMTRREENDPYEEVIREIGEIRKDPKRWEEYIASRADVVLDNWPGRRTRKARKSSATSS